MILAPLSLTNCDGGRVLWLIKCNGLCSLEVGRLTEVSVKEIGAVRRKELVTRGCYHQLRHRQSLVKGCRRNQVGLQDLVGYRQQRRQSGLNWGSWIRVNKISIFPDKFPRNFAFFQAISRKISIFPVKFLRSFNFSGKFVKHLVFSGKFL